MTGERCIVFYHGCDWEGTPARQRYLMEALSEYAPVVFLDGTAERRGRITRYRPTDNVTVVKGAASRMVTLSRRGLEAAIRPSLALPLGWIGKSYKRVLFWNADNWLRPYRFISHDALIYDCIDPCFSTESAVLQEFAAREEEVLRSSRVVFASACSLLEHCRRRHERVTLLNNACAPQDYDSALLAAAPKPAWWPKGSAPIAAYLGSLDWRFDFDFVQAVCRDNPEVHFVIAGKVLPQFAERAARLKELPNVTCPGALSVEEGRYLLSACTVGLILFKPGPMNDAINPVKMYAYALVGKPIVGTAVRELAERPEIAQVASSVPEFKSALRQAIGKAADPAYVCDLVAFARRNTWKERAACAWDVLKDL